MNSQTQHQMKVGIFVAISLAIGMVSIVLFGGDRFLLKNFNNYKIKFDHVQGLAEGSVVSFSGINVGNVSKIELLADENKVILTIEVDQKFAHRITDKTVASVKTQGALGDKFIYLKPGPANANPLTSGDFIYSDPEKDIFELFSEKGEQFASMGDVIEEVHILLKSINQDNNSAMLLKNLVDASGHLSDVLGGLKEKDGNLNQSLQSLASILKKIDNGKGSLGSLINDPTIHDRLVKILGDKPRNQYLTPLIRATIKNNESKSQ